MRRLRRSLGRGMGHSVAGLREELWEEAQEKRARCVVVVSTLSTHGYNAVRGHRTGSNSSGAENYLRRKTNKNTR